MDVIDVHRHFRLYDRGDRGLRGQLVSGSIEIVCRRAQVANICLTVISGLRASYAL